MIKIYSNNSNSEIVSNFIRRRKKDLKSVFGSKCCLCGFSEVQNALEFHHVVPQEKSFNISGHISQTKSLKCQLEELKKCILVCANCHRGIHCGIYAIPSDWQKYYDDNIAQNLLSKLDKKTYYCHRCGAEISHGAKYCVACSNLVARTCERPNREALKQKIRSTTFVDIATQYGVSDNAIRKWCKCYGLPSTKKEIESFSDEEWEKI